MKKELILRQPKRVARLFAKQLYKLGYKENEEEINKTWTMINNYISEMEEKYPKFNAKKFKKLVIDMRDQLAQLSLFPNEEEI